MCQAFFQAYAGLDQFVLKNLISVLRDWSAILVTEDVWLSVELVYALE